jgi:branched-chain amino acid transport system permease protein
LIFAISSFFGGIGGAMFGSISQSVYPATFVVKDSVDFMLNCFLGGLGYVFGPMLGTLALYFGWDLLFEFGKYQMLIYATLLIIIIRFLPNGLLSIRLGKGGVK